MATSGTSEHALGPQQAANARFLAALAGDLAQESSGLTFVYRTLERLTKEYKLTDVVAVVAASASGRQVFRGERRMLAEEDAWARTTVRDASTGVYAEPPVLDPVTRSYVTDLFSVAVQLDFLSHDASHDALTGLLNRRSYETMLDQAVSRSLRYGWPFALMILDLNSFKRINDRMGHVAGDETLRAVGSELRSSLRAGDIAARIGGDEFALILANGGPELLRPLLDRLERAVNDAVPGAAVSFAAGLATFPEDASDADALARIADQRLYAAKP
jgi:diguanylate cyclase (GGDEF)-like protein